MDLTCHETLEGPSVAEIGYARCLQKTLSLCDDVYRLLLLMDHAGTGAVKLSYAQRLLVATYNSLSAGQGLSDEEAARLLSGMTQSTSSRAVARPKKPVTTARKKTLGLTGRGRKAASIAKVNVPTLKRSDGKSPKELTTELSQSTILVTGSDTDSPLPHIETCVACGEDLRNRLLCECGGGRPALEKPEPAGKRIRISSSSRSQTEDHSRGSTVTPVKIRC
jgi:hypothetical protein